MSLRQAKNPILELALGVGFLAVALAVLVARRSPATGYEVSIYTGTPLIAWVLLTGALVAATVVIVRPSSERSTTVATVLGGSAMISVASLPLIRGYYYYGASDSLTHLGWVRDISAGAIEPHSLLYPGYHSLSLALARFTGSSLEQALLLSTLVFFGVFLVFVPLTAKLITGSTRVMGFAAICSWLVLPINNVATHLMPHTNSLALFYLPVVFFSLLLFLRSPQTGIASDKIRPAGIALALIGLGLVVLHIQHAVNLLLLFVVISAVQFVARRRAPDSGVSRHQPLYFHTILLGFFVSVWIASHEIVFRELVLTVRGLTSGSVGTTATVAQRSGSLTTIGGSLTELFVKMFLVSAFVGILAAWYLLVAGRKPERLSRDTGSVLLYFTLALVPLSLLFMLYFLGTPKMSFRQLGFVYVLVTIMGAMAITRFTDWFSRSIPLGRSAATAVLVVCLVLSLLTVFGSPYIYKATPGVSQQEVSGYETTLDTRTDDVPLASLSAQPYRHVDALRGTERSSPTAFQGAGNGTLSQSAVNNGNVTGSYPGDRFHVLLTERETTKQVDIYDQINYRKSGIDAFERDRRSNRVLANGEVEVYLVSSD